MDLQIHSFSNHQNHVLSDELISMQQVRDDALQTTARNKVWSVEEFQFLSFGIVVPIISSVGILLNVFNLFILRNRVQFPESSYTYLFSLALADLLTLFFFLINSFGRGFHRECPEWRRFEIFGYFPIGSMTSNASVLHTVMVTTERFVFMYKPFLSKTYCTRRFARKIIIIIWFSCIVFNLPRFFVMSISPSGNLTFTDFGRSTFYRIISWMSTVLFSIVSAICLIVFNILLIYAIHKRRTTLQNKRLSSLFSQEELNIIPFSKSHSCNTLNRFGCDGSQPLNVEGSKNEIDGDKLKLKRWKAKSSETIEMKYFKGKNCRQILDSKRQSLAVINTRLQQKQKEDFGLTLTLIGVVVLFLVGELPSSFLSRNIVGPLFGEEVLLNSRYVTANVVATLLVVTQHSTNFVIYYILNHKFCNAVKKHFSRCLKMMRHAC